MFTSQQQAKCHQLIDLASSDIIGVMKAFTADNKVNTSIKNERNGKKQFNDFMEAANKTSSLAELELYIAYKGVKEGTRGMWNTLAEPTIGQIKKGGELEYISLKVQEYARDKHKEEFSLDDIHLEVVRRFTGYLMWQANIMIEQAKK